METEIEWSPLEDHTSGEALLKTVFKASGQQIKKYSFNRKWLATPVKAHALIRLPIALVNAKEIWPWVEHQGVEILLENDDFLALHKPAGIHTHPLAYEATPNLVSWLAVARPSLTKINLAGMDRGCLWRLDRETSGLVLYAKSDEAYQRIRQNFSTSFKKKYYWAIVEGNPGAKKDLTHHLASSGPGGERVKVDAKGQLAQLDFETILTQENKSLVLINLKHGLRHQIRVQMAEIGFPLLGDEFYGGARSERLFLHCWRYEMNEGIYEDNKAELFESFFDLNRLLQMLADKIR
ncbi:MAG: RluA family pseudouridine synthase [Bacteriovoracia bacterium]